MWCLLQLESCVGIRDKWRAWISEHHINIAAAGSWRSMSTKKKIQVCIHLGWDLGSLSDHSSLWGAVVTKCSNWSWFALYTGSCFRNRYDGTICLKFFVVFGDVLKHVASSDWCLLNILVSTTSKEKEILFVSIFLLYVHWLILINGFRL
jgi:hypothetical protein